MQNKKLFIKMYFDQNCAFRHNIFIKRELIIIIVPLGTKYIWNEFKDTMEHFNSEVAIAKLITNI